MRRRIMIELQGEEPAVDCIIKDIESTAIGQYAVNELDVFEVHKETLPEKIFPQLRVPGFLVDRPFAEGKRGGM